MSDAVVVVEGALLNAQERMLKRSFWPSLNRAMGLQWAVISITPFLPLLYLSISLNLPSSAIAISAALIVVGLGLAIWLANRVMTTWLREFMRVPTAAEPDDWRVDDESVRISSTQCETTLRWSALVDVEEAPEVFHFVLSPAQVFALPKRCLDAQELVTLAGLIERARARGYLRGVAGP